MQTEAIMKAIKIVHKNENRIKIDFPYNQEIAIKIKQIQDAKWSKTHKAWHIPYTHEAFAQLLSMYPEVEYQNKVPKRTTIEAEAGTPLDTPPVACQESTKVDKANINVRIDVFGKKIVLKNAKKSNRCSFCEFIPI